MGRHIPAGFTHRVASGNLMQRRGANRANFLDFLGNFYRWEWGIIDSRTVFLLIATVLHILIIIVNDKLTAKLSLTLYPQAGANCLHPVRLPSELLRKLRNEIKENIDRQFEAVVTDGDA
jgi:hypothetical protein